MGPRLPSFRPALDEEAPSVEGIEPATWDVSADLVALDGFDRSLSTYLAPKIDCQSLLMAN